MSKTSSPAGPPRPLPIGIVGAGIAGLTLALRLDGLGCKAVVLEARSRASLISEGAFLTLAPNAVNGLRAVGLAEEVVACGTAMTGIEILDERGRRLAFADQADHGESFGAPSVTIARGALMGILLAAAERAGIDIRYEARVEAVRETPDEVQLAIRDGAEISLRWLAACDGLRSPVRQHVFPGCPTPRFTGLIGTGGLVDAPAIPATGGVMRMVFGHVGFFGYLKDGDGPVYWFNSYPAKSPDSDRSDSRYVAWLRDLHWRDPRIIDAILAEVPGIARDYPVFDMPALREWHRGRVVLVGDAAHAVGPHAGQGAAMAIEDAIVLGSCVAQDADLAAAFRRYEMLRRPRVAAVVALTARNGQQKRASTRLDRLARRLILPLLTPGAMKSGRALFAYRVDADAALRGPAIQKSHSSNEDPAVANPNLSDSDVAALAHASMRWYGWGSPVGLGVFIVCLSLAALVTVQAVRTVTGSAWGAHAEVQLSPDSRR
jgi:2-polyprenyl-6-methoxyphenol hydroxylase-like FAD-dependent oxidoreductase